MGIRDQLELVLERFSGGDRIGNDPVRFVRGFSYGGDIETAGLIASSFAYGNVDVIIRTLSSVFGALGESPAGFVDRFYSEPVGSPFVSSFLPGFFYRFNNSDDLRKLLWAIGKIRREWGSLENLFLEGYGGGSSCSGGIASGLEHFSRIFLEVGGESPFRNCRNYEYFFPRPSGGSPCKRLCLFLRWMCRRDAVDPGGWEKVDPACLVIPVDTHIARIGRYLGFTSRKNPSWAMAEEITAALRKLDASDPLKYDFALCHLGISGKCPHRYDPGICSLCVLGDMCSRGSPSDVCS